LALLLAGAEPTPAPARVDQPEQLVDVTDLGLVVALEHLMDEDPEALVERRLGRDPKDARELVLQRAGPVRVDVRGAEEQPLAAPRQERLQRRLVARGDGGGTGARVALGIEQRIVQRRGLEDLALLGGRGLEDRRVDAGK